MRRSTGFACGVAVLLLPTYAFAQEATQASAPASPPAAEKLVCKSELEVGSLVKRKKRCFTQAEWRRIREGAQDSGQVLQERARR